MHLFIQAHCSRLKPELDLTYITKLNGQKHEGSLRAHRVVFIVCILHLANALGPVRFRRCNTDLGPSLGYQNRQRVIPRRGELCTRPMVEIDVTIAARQLQALMTEMTCMSSAPQHEWRILHFANFAMWPFFDFRILHFTFSSAGFHSFALQPIQFENSYKRFKKMTAWPNDIVTTATADLRRNQCAQAAAARLKHHQVNLFGLGDSGEATRRAKCLEAAMLRFVLGNEPSKVQLGGCE